MHVHTRATKHIGIQIEMNQNGKGGGGKKVAPLLRSLNFEKCILVQRIHWRKEKQIEGKSYKTCMIVIYD